MTETKPTKFDPNFDDRVLMKEMSGKVIGYMAGNFGPAHKGHFNAVVRVIRELHLDFVILLTVNRTEARWSRHGVPLFETIRIWKEWAQVIYQHYGTKLYISEFPPMYYVPEDIQTFYLVSIEEKLSFLEFEQHAQKAIQQSLNLSSVFALHVPRDKFKRAFFLRQDDGLSATNFVRCLMTQKQDDECLKFTPDQVPIEQNRAYVRHLRENFVLKE